MAHKAIRVSEEEFVEMFLGLQGIDASQVPKAVLASNPLAKLQKADDMVEAEISDKMCHAINQKELIPGLKMALSEHGKDSLLVDPDGQKIDGALFPEAYAPTDGRPHWPDQITPMEFKTKTRDPFDDKTDEVEADAKDRKASRGQVTHYAELICTVQHRTFLIMLVIIGRKCRVLHWDRAAVVVSQAFDYYHRWEFFADILWRIAVLHRLAPERLGLDPSAVRIHADDPDWKLMDDAAVAQNTDVDREERVLAPDELTNEDVTYAYVRAAFGGTLHDEWPRYRLEVPDGDAVRTLLICRPYFQAKGMIGRGTRGYVALEKLGDKALRFVWLKDAWRYGGITPEGVTLQLLNQAKVKNVPTLICHGDIRNQRTKSHEYWARQHPPRIPPSHPLPSATTSARTLVDPGPGTSAGSKRKWSEDTAEPTLAQPTDFSEEIAAVPEDCPLRLHIHYRIVVKEVCMPLSMFASGYQLVSLLIDCLEAHHMATDKQILHRDISRGNILIYPKVESSEDKETKVVTRQLRWHGILTDWELSKSLGGPMATRARQCERTGTWQSMSVAILLDPYKVVDICDDFESVVHVLIYHAVRYLPSDCERVGDWIEDFFDSYNISADGSYLCGTLKRVTIQDAGRLRLTTTGKPLLFKGPMDRLLHTLLQAFKAYYAVKTYDSQPKCLPAPRSTAMGPPSPSPSPSSSERRPIKRLRPSYTKPLPGPSLTNTSTYAPTQEDRDLALHVQDHRRMIGMLYDALSDEEWDLEEGKVKPRDRIPKDWQPRRAFGPSVVSMLNQSNRTLLEQHSLQGVINRADSTPTKSSSSSSSLPSLPRPPSKIAAMRPNPKPKKDSTLGESAQSGPSKHSRNTRPSGGL